MTDRIEAALADLAAAIRAEIQRTVAERESPPELLSVEEAARRAGVGRSLLYGLIARGRLRSVKVGRRRLIPADAIGELARQPLSSPARMGGS